MYQRRYVNYARIHGREPSDMLAADTERWPGGKMCGFILWISDRWQEFERLFGKRYIKTAADHAEFDAWLATLPIDK